MTPEMRGALEDLANFGEVINEGWSNDYEQDVLREYSHLCDAFMHFLLEQMWEEEK
jgi:hypothetical protein